MDYCRMIEGWPFIVNVLLAIFFPVLHWIYALIIDVNRNNTIALILDIIAFVAGLFIYWLLNLIWILLKGKPFSFSEILR